MHFLSRSLGILVAAGLLHVPASTGEGPARYRTYSENRVTLTGTTSVHDWTAEGDVIRGFLEPGEGFPSAVGPEVAPGIVKAGAEIAIPVASLRSGYRSMDQVMRAKLREPSHPDITYRLSEMRLESAPAGPDAETAYRCEAVGMLAIAGVTNRISMPVEVRLVAAERIRITGRTTLKMSDFGVEHEPIGTTDGHRIHIGDEVRIEFQWLVAP